VFALVQTTVAYRGHVDILQLMETCPAEGNIVPLEVPRSYSCGFFIA